MHSPTPEQTAIISAARDTSTNLLIEALAGTGKTSTLEMICEALPVQPILSLAFNKRIAEEMAKRLPGHVQASTINSVCHRAFATAIGKRLTVDEKKGRDIVREVARGYPEQTRGAILGALGDYARALSLAKSIGYIPSGTFPQATRLTEDPWDYLSTETDLDFGSFEQGFLNACLRKSINQSFDGLIDFTDQLYMPTLFTGAFPAFNLVLVDEAQDLSPLNHETLSRLVVQRLIAVGDKFQSIYAFRGAEVNSMNLLRKRFDMQVLPLSTSFRCPRLIVERARFRVPHFNFTSAAPLGEVVELSSWSADDIPEPIGIVCRNNAPLYHLALKLMQKGRGVQLVGRELGPKLVKTLANLGPGAASQEEVLRLIDLWEHTELARARTEAKREVVAERAESLRTFAHFGTTLAEAVAHAEKLFSTSAAATQLLSIHKAKGLEWDHVLHLDPWRIPSRYATTPAAIEQELNLRYVAETRPRRRLFLANLKDFKEKP